MIIKKDLIVELNFLSDILSNRVRTISGGILALCWLLILQNLSKPNKLAVFSTTSLLIPSAIAVLALLADFAQYLFGYVTTRSLLRKMERANLRRAQYDYGSFAYRSRMIMFYLKQVLTLVASAWFLLLVSGAIFK